MSAQPIANKQRSPNYPAIGLAEAIDRLRAIYETQRRYPATREVLVKLMGYGSLNGASATMVSALSKYGLLEGHGDNLRVSEMGQDLILHRKGDPEYAVALRTAAFRPAFFRELNEQYPHGLPSDHSLRATLTKRGFNPKSIDGAVRAYRDTMDFVDAEAGGDDAEAEDGAGAAMGVPSPTPTPFPTSDGVGLADHRSPGWVADLLPPSGAEELVLWFRLSQESEVRSVFKGRVTQEAIKKFVRLLEESCDTFPSGSGANAAPLDTDDDGRVA